MQYTFNINIYNIKIRRKYFYDKFYYKVIEIKKFNNTKEI